MAAVKASIFILVKACGSWWGSEAGWLCGSLPLSEKALPVAAIRVTGPPVCETKRSTQNGQFRRSNWEACVLSVRGRRLGPRQCQRRACGLPAAAGSQLGGRHVCPELRGRDLLKQALQGRGAGRERERERELRGASTGGAGVQDWGASSQPAQARAASPPTLSPHSPHSPRSAPPQLGGQAGSPGPPGAAHPAGQYRRHFEVGQAFEGAGGGVHASRHQERAAQVAQLGKLGRVGGWVGVEGWRVLGGWGWDVGRDRMWGGAGGGGRTPGPGGCYCTLAWHLPSPPFVRRYSVQRCCD